MSEDLDQLYDWMRSLSTKIQDLEARVSALEPSPSEDDADFTDYEDEFHLFNVNGDEGEMDH